MGKKHSIMAPSTIKVPDSPNLYWAGCCQSGIIVYRPHNRWAILQGHTFPSQHCNLPQAYTLVTFWSSSLWLSQNTGEQGTWRMNFLHVCGALWPSHRTPMRSPEEKLLQWVTKEGRKHRCAFARGDAVQHGCASWGRFVGALHYCKKRSPAFRQTAIHFRQLKK